MSGFASVKLVTDFLANRIKALDVALAALGATGLFRARINRMMRVYLYSNGRWIALADDNYGVMYINATENAGTGVDPIVEWECQGEPFSKGDVLNSLEIRARENSTLDIADIEIMVAYVQPNPITRWLTGINADNEMLTTTLHRDFWINPLNGDPVLGHLVTHRGRRIFPLNYTCPEDGEMRIFVRPIRQGASTTTRYFYATMKLDYEIKG